MLKIGDRAPEFKLKSDTGTDVSLRDFKGQRVVLFFFPKADTPG
jgi:peroxiredoxin Q/BCP